MYIAADAGGSGGIDARNWCRLLNVPSLINRLCYTNGDFIIAFISYELFTNIRALSFNYDTIWWSITNEQNNG